MKEAERIAASRSVHLGETAIIQEKSPSKRNATVAGEDEPVVKKSRENVSESVPSTSHSSGVKSDDQKGKVVSDLAAIKEKTPSKRNATAIGEAQPVPKKFCKDKVASEKAASGTSENGRHAQKVDQSDATGDGLPTKKRNKSGSGLSVVQSGMIRPQRKASGKAKLAISSAFVSQAKKH